MTDDRTITTETLVWQGITIEVRYDAEWLVPKDMASRYAFAHLEIRSIDPERAPLPITGTGYPSHFTHPDVITEAGGPVAYVLAGLEEAAQTPDWRRQQEQARQLNLF